MKGRKYNIRTVSCAFLNFDKNTPCVQCQHEQKKLDDTSLISFYPFITILDRIGGVITNVLVSSVVDSRIESRPVKTKDYKIGICCVSSKHAALTRKSKDWFDRNQNNVSDWGDMVTRGLLFQ